MKKALPLVLLFFLCNAIGLNVGALYYVLPLKYELININSEAYNAAALQTDMIFKVNLTWLVCALFSFSIFFVHGIWRKIFLLAPIVIPVLYATILLQAHI
ncbi:MAG: hypothetical protein ACRBDL_11125 [Alphaproteobacteria bacterium]